MGCGASSPQLNLAVKPTYEHVAQPKDPLEKPDDGTGGQKADDWMAAELVVDGVIDDEALDKAATKIQALHRGKRTRAEVEAVRARCLASERTLLNPRVRTASSHLPNSPTPLSLS